MKGKYVIPKSNWQIMEPAGVIPILDKSKVFTTPRKSDANSRTSTITPRKPTPKSKKVTLTGSVKINPAPEEKPAPKFTHTGIISQLSENSLLDYQNKYMMRGNRRRVVKQETAENTV